MRRRETRDGAGVRRVSSAGASCDPGARRRPRPWIAVLALCATVTACGRAPTGGLETAPGPAAAAASAEAPPLVVGVSALRISLPVFVASERGLFARHGARVELRRFDTAQPLVEEVVDGRLDAGGYAALPIVLAAAGTAGHGVRLATGLVEDEAHPVSVLLRRAGDATLASVADLRGRRVGVLPTVAYTRWLARVLEHAGLAESDVTVVPVAPPLQASTLAEGGVDALFTNDPMATAAVAASVAERFGPSAPVPDALGGPHVFGSFLVAEDTVRRRPDDVAALLRALDDAIREIERDPAAAADAMLPFLREPERAFVRLYPAPSYLDRAGLDQARLALEVERIRALELSPAVPDVTGWSLGGASP